MAYLRRHPEFVEGPQYVDKYVQLLSRALALVKNQVNIQCIHAIILTHICSAADLYLLPGMITHHYCCTECLEVWYNITNYTGRSCCCGQRMFIYHNNRQMTQACPAAAGKECWYNTTADILHRSCCCWQRMLIPGISQQKTNYTGPAAVGKECWYSTTTDKLHRQVLLSPKGKGCRYITTTDKFTGGSCLPL